ncbi:MAG: hypothetical protein D6740_03175 [Alphaproteobacteria bacterium]|nr:MAG: hypothetical protein D6740_03175 [Alphaproteobacteria bacterium]
MGQRLVAIAIALAALLLALDRQFPVLAQPGRIIGGGEPCRIKGNISAAGERIYHLPGDRYYAATRIDRWKGERWFCSEEEAERAGFRRARW